MKNIITILILYLLTTKIAIAQVTVKPVSSECNSVIVEYQNNQLQEATVVLEIEVQIGIFSPVQSLRTVGTTYARFNNIPNGKYRVFVKVDQVTENIQLWNKLDNTSNTFEISCTETSQRQSSKSISEFKVYPNPTSDLLNFNIPNINDIWAIKIYDTVGRLIYKGDDKVLQVSDYKPGAYFVEFESGNIKAVEKIIIE